MWRNHLKIALRNIVKNKFSSFLNLSGLAMGIAVTILIGLWIWDELSFNKYHQHYDRIAQVMEKDTYNGIVSTGTAIPLPLEDELRKSYGHDFKHIVMSSWTEIHVLIAGDKKISYPGNFIGAEAPEMFTLKMLKGSRKGLTGPSSMLIAQSVANALFGNAEPIGKMIRIDDKAGFIVSGVYEDLPLNTTLHEVAFMAPWDFFVNAKDWIQRDPSNWNDNSLFMYVEIGDHEEMNSISKKIKDIKLNKAEPAEAKMKPEIFLQPMARWHLYNEFRNGVNSGGAIQYVWLFGIIGIFVLLLACINFMNLSTARSEKRAKEVGIRKAIGSIRRQLIGQFFCESLLLALLSFVISLFLVWLALPLFNEVAGKKMNIAWNQPVFWLLGIGFTVFTGLIAGSYPAIYLSSFQPVKVLKGTFKTGRRAAIPRKILVVLQFAVSIVLIIGTIAVFEQLQFAKSRPVGYNRHGLIDIDVTNSDLVDHFNEVREDLIRTGAVTELAGSSSPTTGINNYRNDVNWKGKDATMIVDFANIHVTSEYGKTVGWQFTAGRDFSTQLTTDVSAVVLNETAVKYMGLKNPVGETIGIGKRNVTVIGVIKDMIMASPYEAAKQTVYLLSNRGFEDVIIKINPGVSTRNALHKIESVLKTWSPSVPFAYKFVDEEYASKFSLEERIGRLAWAFAALAIFISCLGLFGMAAFVAEQRTKEIGVRKIVGASAFSLWRLLSSDFAKMVLIACVAAIPVANYFLKEWLSTYEYRVEISWWIYVTAAGGAMIIALLTVSFQTIKAARANPVSSLRTE